MANGQKIEGLPPGWRVSKVVPVPGETGWLATLERIGPMRRVQVVEFELREGESLTSITALGYTNGNLDRAERRSASRSRIEERDAGK